MGEAQAKIWDCARCGVRAMPAYLLSGKTYCSGCYWEKRATGSVTNTSGDAAMPSHPSGIRGLSQKPPEGAGVTIETLTSKFDAQIADLVNRERSAVYGHPQENFTRNAALRAIVAECLDPALRVTLQEICTKLSRLIQSPDHFDSWLDIAGYARCAVMILDKRNEKK